MPKFQLAMAGIFLGFAVVIWLAFLRPVPVRSAVGVVRSRALAPAGEYVQYQPGSRSSFHTPTTISMPEHYVLGIQLDGHRTEMRYAANPVEASNFAVGQRVSVEYQERGLPPFWRRSYITDLKRAD